MLCYHQNADLCVHAPRGHILSFFAKKTKVNSLNPENSLNPAVQVKAVVGQHSRVTMHCCQLTPLRDFGGKQFQSEMSRVLEVTNESALSWEENFHLFNKKYYGIFSFRHVALDVFFFHWRVLVLGLMLSLISCAKRLDRDYRNTGRHHFHLFYLIREPG